MIDDPLFGEVPVSLPPAHAGAVETAEPVDEEAAWLSKVPKTLPATKSVSGRRIVAGEGRIPADIMFIASAISDEEAQTKIEGSFGRGDVSVTPRYLKGPAGCILKDTLSSLGVEISQHYYTAMIKWLVPRAERSKPSKERLAAAMPILLDEIARVQPKIIVTFGKPMFDAIVGLKVKFDDVRAAWFWSERFNAKVFVMQDIQLPVFKPEMVEKYRIELHEVKRMLDETRGIEIVRAPEDYSIISTAEQLEEFTRMLAGEKKNILSVDAEFGGRNHLDGRLRSLQVGFDIGRARFLRFMDDRLNYVFPVPYAAAGNIMKPHFDAPRTQYIGYHISTDLPWMHHWLGLQWYGKCMIDVEGAEQVIDENAELGLERVALKYTDLGRYDIDLVQWKMANRDKLSDDLGYLLVPDDILVPYGCKDVDAPFRATPELIRRMRLDGVLNYYRNFRHPLVTDIFTQFALLGLPIAEHKLSELRKLYSFSRTLLERKFLEKICVEAKEILLKTLMRARPEPQVVAVFHHIVKLVEERKYGEATDEMKSFVGVANVAKCLPVLQHFIESPGFNIRSNPAKLRWLFQVKGHEPVKSTNNKEKGLPSMPWARVKNLPPNVQKLYSPAADKQTLKLIADDYDDPTVKYLLDVLAVGNVCKAFLKEAEVDEDGEVVKENGLHYWLASDGRVHGQMSVTETGRPRAWKPNSLNWPGYVHEGVARGIAEVLAEQNALQQLPEEFKKFINPKAIPSIRSVVDVTNMPPLPGSQGWCIVESDYVTAEIRGLGFLSGDEKLIKLMTEPDDQFGFVVEDGKKVKVRLRYSEECGIPESHRDPQFIFTHATKGQVLGRYPWSKLQRDSKGGLIHPPHDLHWSLVEWVQEAPRELFNEKIDRTGTGKVGNFSSAYGATANTLERKIKADTGKTPEPGTGTRILDALGRRQPEATKWLQGLAELPMNPGGGFWVAESGAKRRFVTHGFGAFGLTAKERLKIASSLGREARNFPMQESVAASASRACQNLLAYYRANNFHAGILACLYDSVLTLCPVEERWAVVELHDRFMNRENVWHNHGRTWSYPIETEINLAWSSRPPEDARIKLEDKNWASVAPWLPAVLP